MRAWHAAVLPVVLLGLCACAAAPRPVPAEPELTCQEEVHRQFDFWIGDWEVLQEDRDAPRAFNHIRQLGRGCFLHEDYSSGSGYVGESLNWYDPKFGQWRQIWADSQGLILYLAGGLDAQGRMVLYGGERVTAEGRSIRDRITWEPRRDGSVRQSWDISSDGGKRWREIFSGLYVPRVETGGSGGGSKRSLKP